MYQNQQLAHSMTAGDYAAKIADSAMNRLGGDPVRRPEMSIQMDKLGTALGYAEDSLNELEKRLEGVLRPLIPEGKGDSQLTAAPPLSSYAQGIAGQAARAGGIGERIQSLIRRLEV